MQGHATHHIYQHIQHLPSTRSIANMINSSPSFSKMEINETKWVERMRNSIEEHHDDGKDPVTIFSVPKVLLTTDPKCYIPQQIALGPYHHWNVYDMQSYKLAAVRKAQQYMNVKFEHLVEIMKEHDEARIRARYQKYLEMNGDTLMWMMAIDVTFLLEFLQVCSMKEDDRNKLYNDKGVECGKMSHVVDITGKKLSHIAILRDVVMVENQIPLFLVKKMLEHQVKKTSGQLHSVDDMLKTMLMGLYHKLTLFNVEETRLPDVHIDEYAHLLDFLYRMTVGNNKEHHEEHQGKNDNEAELHVTIESADGENNDESVPKKDELRKGMNIVSAVSAILVAFLGIMKKGKIASLTKVAKKNPLVGKVINDAKEEMLENICHDENKNPRIEITIPSVTQMAKVGIRFKRIDHGGISDISFDSKTRTLNLPVVKVGVNTEVYLRNLVAYEACVGLPSLVMARYTELMNGIIDTEEDAKYLRERDIVVSSLKSDKEVADLWNGMSKSVKFTKVKELDKVITDVNKMYDRTWRVKLSKYLKKYVFASWKILTLLATLLMLLLTAIQAFCSVYTCARVFRKLPEFPAE